MKKSFSKAFQRIITHEKAKFLMTIYGLWRIKQKILAYPDNWVEREPSPEELDSYIKEIEQEETNENK